MLFGRLAGLLLVTGSLAVGCRDEARDASSHQESSTRTEAARVAAVPSSPPKKKKKRRAKSKRDKDETPQFLDPLQPWAGPGPRPPDKVEGTERLLYETRSELSHIRVRQTGPRRILTFVQENGAEWRQTVMNLKRPEVPAMPYARAMFVSFLYEPKPERVLLVGLGGGAMIPFFSHHRPEVDVTAVEIDPAVVRVAAEWFGVTANEHTKIVTADAAQFIAKSKESWDVIYIDAFLEPSTESTDSSGVPKQLKTDPFLRALAKRVGKNGFVVFNLHAKTPMSEHIAAIERVFSAAHLYRVERSGNRILVATQQKSLPSRETLAQRAAELDASINAGFSFTSLAHALIVEPQEQPARAIPATPPAP